MTFHDIIWQLNLFLRGLFFFATIMDRLIFIMHIINSPYNFSIQNYLQNSYRVKLGFQSPKRHIIKHVKKHTKLYSIELLRTEMTSDCSTNHREYSPYCSHSLFQFEGSDVISSLKNSMEYSLCSLRSGITVSKFINLHIIYFRCSFQNEVFFPANEEIIW